MIKKEKTQFYLKLLILFLIIGIVLVGIRYYRQSSIVPQILNTVEGAGLWAPLFYVLFYILISGILIPSIVIKIFGGTLFGVAGGIVLVSVASTVSSLIKFLLGRYLFRKKIQRKIERSQNLKAIDQLIERDGWKVLIILRNVPIVNSMVLNYLCGLTKMKIKDFVFASFIGRLPTTVLYVYLGYFVRYTYRAGVPINKENYWTAEKVVFFIGLAAVAAASVYLIHLCRKVLFKKLPLSFQHVKKWRSSVE